MVKNPPAMQETQETPVRSCSREETVGNGKPLQSSCLENSTDRGAWWATVHGVTNSDATEGLSNRHCPAVFPSGGTFSNRLRRKKKKKGQSIS